MAVAASHSAVDAVAAPAAPVVSAPMAAVPSAGLAPLWQAAPLYAVVMALAAWATHQGEMAPWRLYLLAGLGAAGGLALAGLMRSGVSMRWRDPALTLPRLLLNVSFVVLAYALFEAWRGVMLPLLCVALVFEMQRIEPRRLAAVAAGSVAALVGVSAITPSRESWAALALSVVMLPALMWVAQHVHGMRLRHASLGRELADVRRRLHKSTTRDALTELYNRTHMMTLIEREARRQRRKSGVFSAALLDIDGFRRLNDTHGEAVGDAVLHDFSRRLRRAIRECDVVARWSDAGFLVLMPDTGRAEAIAALGRMRTKVVKHDWGRLVPGLSVRFSAGIVQHGGADALPRTLEQLERALDQAKSQGPDRIVSV